MAPEDQTYYIRWGTGASTEYVGEKVDPELGYRDYPVPRIASDNYGRYDIRIVAGDKYAHRPEDQEVPLGAILFLYGEYVACQGGRDTLYFSWQPGASFSPPITRMLCGSHRYAPL
jgi:hypothetical protein